MRTRFELADAVNLFGAGLISRTKLTLLQTRVLGKIATCRTATLGGHEEACENCGTARFSYNSCGDRHCLPIAIGTRLQNRHSGLTTWCVAPCL